MHLTYRLKVYWLVTVTASFIPKWYPVCLILCFLLNRLHFYVSYKNFRVF
jgi:hypothetical protein